MVGRGSTLVKRTAPEGRKHHREGRKHCKDARSSNGNNVRHQEGGDVGTSTGKGERKEEEAGGVRGQTKFFFLLIGC